MTRPRTNYGTHYLETEAILAAQQDDTETLDAILAIMSPGEQASLAYAAQVLLDRISVRESGDS